MLHNSRFSAIDLLEATFRKDRRDVDIKPITESRQIITRQDDINAHVPAISAGQSIENM
jgi:hypothetical protein